MRRTKLHEYQSSYAAAMKPFGLQRGIVGSTAKHQANSDYYRQQVIRYEEDIAKLQADVEKAQEGRNTILSWFGKGDLAKAKTEYLEALRESPKAEGKERIYTHGEKEVLAEKERREHGLPVNDNTMVELANLCGYLGLDFNKYFDGYELSKESKFFTGNY